MSESGTITEQTPNGIFKTWWQGGDRYAENISAEGLPLKLDFENGALYSPAIWDQLHTGIKLRTLDFTKVFGNDNPLNFEIGIGNGEFIAKYAAERTNENWLGVEVFKQVFHKAAARAAKSSAGNIRVIQFDALLILRLVPDAYLNRIYVNFPDPWPKTQHKRRRLLKVPLLELAASKLKKEGILHIATDHSDYAEEIAENIAQVNLLQSISGNVYERHADDYFPTKYYKKFALNGGAYYFRYAKVTE